jgi:hypothetical protein
VEVLAGERIIEEVVEKVNRLYPQKKRKKQ